MSNYLDQNDSNYQYVVQYEDKIESHPVDINLQNVKNIVYEKQNPHPLIGIAITLFSLAIIYIIYIVLIKRKLTGEWVGKLGNLPGTHKIRIYHNTLTDAIYLYTSDNMISGYGYIYGDTIWLYVEDKKIAGVIVENNDIVWVDSKDVWHHIKILR